MKEGDERIRLQRHRLWCRLQPQIFRVAWREYDGGWLRVSHRVWRLVVTAVVTTRVVVVAEGIVRMQLCKWRQNSQKLRDRRGHLASARRLR